MVQPRVTVNRNGIRDLLLSDDVRRDLEARAARVEQAAKATAPRDTGQLADSITTETVRRSDRWVARVVADVPYGAKVSATNPFLAASLDAARGT